jgi:carbamoyltransferase
MIYWGINALNHGSSLAVVNGSNTINISSDSDNLPETAIRHALEYHGAPDRIFWYENPWLKKARQIYAGQYKTAFNMDNLPKTNLCKWGLGYAPVTYTPHHASHAAAGYYTSPFDHCAIVVIDAIGEFDTTSIWEAKDGKIKKVWSAKYPNSLGLFYSAFTQLMGLKPIRDEGVLQQMASLGDPIRYRRLISDYFRVGTVALDYNFHRGVINWDTPFMNVEDQCDLAAAVQERFELEISKIMFKAKQMTGADSLVYMGGCAMNSDANRNEVSTRFKYVWSLPNPGDDSSALGAVLYHTKQRIVKQWAPVKHIEIKTQE